MSILWSIVVLSCSVWLAAAILPGIKVRSFWDAVVVSIIFGVVNFLFGWVLFTFIGLATLGLGFLLSFVTKLIVSASMLKLTDALTDRLKIDGFGWAIAGAAIIAALGSAAERYL